MIDDTSVLFWLEDEFVVASLERLSSRDLGDVIEHREREAACPGCGTLTARVKDRSLVRALDLDACGQVIQLWGRKRRLACLEPLCAAGSFMQQSAAIPAPATAVTAGKAFVATCPREGVGEREPAGSRGPLRGWGVALLPLGEVDQLEGVGLGRVVVPLGDVAGPSRPRATVSCSSATKSVAGTASVPAVRTTASERS